MLYAFTTLLIMLSLTRGFIIQSRFITTKTSTSHAFFIPNHFYSTSKSFSSSSLSSMAEMESTGSSSSSLPSSSTSVIEQVTDLSKLEIRVGKIVEISKHPEAENLYVEKVDIGESQGPRIIVSGLVQYCTVDSLLNRNVIVLCNLKPRPLKGITSYGMLLCASNTDHTQVVPLDPPADVMIGQLITFQGHKPEPVEPGNKASKSFSKIADDFFVDDKGVATFQGIPFMTPQGVVTSTLKGKIS